MTDIRLYSLTFEERLEMHMLGTDDLSRAKRRLEKNLEFIDSGLSGRPEARGTLESLQKKLDRMDSVKYRQIYNRVTDWYAKYQNWLYDENRMDADMLFMYEPEHREIYNGYDLESADNGYRNLLWYYWGEGTSLYVDDQLMCSYSASDDIDKERDYT